MKNKEEKTNLKRNLMEYLGFLKNYKGYFSILIIVIILVEILKLIEKFLFAKLIDSGTNYSSGILTFELFKGVLISLLFIFLTSELLRAFLIWHRVKLLILIDSNMIVDLKQKYFNHLISLDPEFHTSHKTGSLISRPGRGAGAVEGLTDTIAFQFTPIIVQVIAVSISIAYFNVIPAIILFLTSIIFIAYSIIIQNLQRKDKLIYNNYEDFEKGNMADYFTNVESVKFFGKDNMIKQKYKKLILETREKGLKYWEWYKLFDSGQILILGIGTIFLLYFPIVDFINGEITIGTISFIYTAYLGLTIALYGFVWGIRGFYRSLTDLESLFYYNKFTNLIKDKKNAKELKIKMGEIEFKDINFKYPNNTEVFNNFNLKIPSGKKVAFVGESGCGKTTLVKLLYRFYNLNSGKILIDKEDIRNFKQESLRSEMAIVSQEPILFDDTIYNNIKFSNPKSKREDVLKAIKFAQLDKVIDKFDKKEHTIVGERGVKLSGGQKQRVSIARAILANKKILILDEATSSLDSETEFEIQKDLEDLMKKRTSIIIAHRLSTIMKADLIVVLKNGEIVQKGNHRELITQGGEYARLWDFQKGGYIQ
jgi:ATP-binding cassette, subfamily B, heavy metal transporter